MEGILTEDDRKELQADLAEDLDLTDGSAGDVRGGGAASKEEIYKKSLEQGTGHDFWAAK
jgi:hypothetical protein